jgi:hypothetical protein
MLAVKRLAHKVTISENIFDRTDNFVAKYGIEEAA